MLAWDCTPFNVYESATYADWHEVAGRCVVRLNLWIEGEPLFSSLLRYCIKSSDRRLRHTIWRKSWCFDKLYHFIKNEKIGYHSYSNRF